MASQRFETPADRLVPFSSERGRDLPEVTQTQPARSPAQCLSRPSRLKAGPRGSGSVGSAGAQPSRIGTVTWDLDRALRWPGRKGHELLRGSPRPARGHGAFPGLPEAPMGLRSLGFVRSPSQRQNACRGSLEAGGEKRASPTEGTAGQRQEPVGQRGCWRAGRVTGPCPC